MDTLLVLFVLAIPVGIFALIINILHSISLMQTRLAFDPGPPVRKSLWGSVAVNGVVFKNTARVEEYAEGYLVRARIGRGKLWLPKRDLEIGQLESGTRWVWDRRRLRSGFHEVWLCGPLANFIGA